LRSPHQNLDEESAEIIQIAKRGKFSINEIVVVIVWFELVFLLAQKFFGKPLLVTGLSLTSLSEALLLLPFMSLIFFPIYIKKIKRIIKIQIFKRSENNSNNDLKN
jgi:hypothetical protein